MKNVSCIIFILLFGAPLLLIGCGGNSVSSGSQTEIGLPPDYPFPSDHAVSEWTASNGKENELLLREGPDFPSVRFMTVSDIHHFSPELWTPGSAVDNFLASNDGKLLMQSGSLLKGLELAVLRETPTFLLVTGDLTTNGSRESHREMAAVFNRIEAAGIEVYVAPGNHDLLNPWAAGFYGDKVEQKDGIGPEEFRKLYNDFGFSEALDSSSVTLSYVVEPVKGLRLVVIDSASYIENEEKGYPDSAGYIDIRDETWLSAVLAKAAEEGTAVLVGMHHSLLPHTDRTAGGYIIEEWPKFARMFWDGAASVIFSGHIHAQDTAGLRGLKGEWLYDISTGAFAIYPHSYRIAAIDGESQTLKLIPGRLEKLPGWDGSIDFRVYSREIYLDSLTGRMSKRLQSTYPVSAGDAELMSDYIAVLSLNHFAGEEQGDLPPELLADARTKWNERAPEDLQDYIERMGTDPPPKDNNIVVDLSAGYWRSIR